MSTALIIGCGSLERNHQFREYRLFITSTTFSSVTLPPGIVIYISGTLIKPHFKRSFRFYLAKKTIWSKFVILYSI